MNHAAARAAVEALFAGRGRRLGQLRAHLEGCAECRAHYDRTARAFRALSGRPEEMTSEELLLFAPPLPGQAPARGWVPALWIGALATAAAAMVVVFAGFEPRGGFSPRGGTPPAERSSARAFCSRDAGTALVVADPAAGGCLCGDRLAFVATGRGRRFVAVALLEAGRAEVVIWGAEGALAAEGSEVVLPNSSTWRPGLRAVALYSDTPIGPAQAERCALGACPPSLERTEIPLGPER